ncbi:gamma-glutamyltranspeptidase [Backusella circina FSU 941]|nr:gamma-glutamyltranspeptidase [Backusella circina FSU 941]
MSTSDIERANESDPLIKNSPKRPHKKTKFTMITAAASLLVLGALSMWQLQPPNSLKSPVDFEGYVVKGTKGAVAVESELCSNVGVDILKKGGNAVDAAIASTLCIGVIDSFATGGFMLIRSPNGSFEFIDFRETAPKAAHQDMFVKDPMLAKIGPLAIGVPGELRGLELAHKRHGKMSWSSLFEPAIQLSRDGFETTPLLELRLKTEQGWMQKSKEWTDVYFKNGAPVKKGDIVKRPMLADTLEAVANNGTDVFYEGKIAESMVNTVQAAGGILTLEDFKDYHPVIRPTISTYYNGRKITTCSEPTGGPVLLSILNIIERFQFKVQGFVGENLHRLIEGFKFGYAFRTEMGDPDIIDNEERMKEIIDKDFAAKIRRKIDEKTHDTMYYGPKYDQIESHGTMHLSVVDKDNGAVSLTSTVNLMFGSHILDEKTGVILNNQMDDFSIPGTPNMFGLPPSVANYAGSRKRPLSSATPTIIEKDSEFEIAIGGSGGSLIPTATLYAIVNFLDYGKNLYDSIAAPRIHHQLMPNIAIVENGFNKQFAKQLIKRGHQIFDLPKEYSVSAVQAVRRAFDGTVEAVSDPRKMGIAAAY